MEKSGLKSRFCNCVIGTVAPVLAMSKENGSLDEKAIPRHVEFLIDCGVETLMCAVGTSRMMRLPFLK